MPRLCSPDAKIFPFRFVSTLSCPTLDNKLPFNPPTSTGDLKESLLLALYMGQAVLDFRLPRGFCVIRTLPAPISSRKSAERQPTPAL